jgi:hypothetical protein
LNLPLAKPPRYLKLPPYYQATAYERTCNRTSIAAVEETLKIKQQYSKNKRSFKYDTLTVVKMHIVSSHTQQNQRTEVKHLKIVLKIAPEMMKIHQRPSKPQYSYSAVTLHSTVFTECAIQCNAKKKINIRHKPY